MSYDIYFVRRDPGQSFEDALDATEESFEGDPGPLSEGDLVRVFNALGEVHCPLTIAPSIRPGTVSLPKGLWRRSTRNGLTATALVPDTLTDLGGGACFNDARVQVSSLANA